MSLGATPSALRPATTRESEVSAGISARPVPGLCWIEAVVRGTTTVSPAEGVGLNHHRLFFHAKRQAALRHRDPADPDVLAHHNRAGSLVHHNPRHRLRYDLEILDPAHDPGRRAQPSEVEGDRPCIEHGCHAPAKLAIDPILDTSGGGEVG